MNRTYKLFSLVVIATLFMGTLTQAKAQENPTQKAKSQTSQAVQGTTTPGQVAKFGTNGKVTDSNITEDGTGNIGIGTTLPTSTLTVQGMIETTLGGYKFPDGTVQTTAGLSTILTDGSLKGNGTQTSRLGIRVPLQLFDSLSFSAVLNVSNGAQNGFGIQANGGPQGVAIRARGGAGGLAIEAVGGQLDGGVAGDGLRGFGGISNDGTGGTGVFAMGGTATGAGNQAGHGVEAFAGFGLGAANGFAGLFHGNVQVTGVLSKAGGSFKIDHPLDPENKYLSHSFVESPDMMNIYNGNTTTDQSGRAVIDLPEWFEALNKDFRYQLTVLGTFAQAIVAEEVKGNRFAIQTSVPNIKVSWQVTGIRQDAWANKNRIPVEEVKSERERGYYLHPEAFGKDEERSITAVQEPEVMRELKQRRLEAEKSRLPRQ